MLVKYIARVPRRRGGGASVWANERVVGRPSNVIFFEAAPMLGWLVVDDGLALRCGRAHTGLVAIEMCIQFNCNQMSLAEKARRWPGEGLGLLMMGLSDWGGS